MPFSVTWENKKMDKIGCLLLFIAIVVVIAYFTLRQSYYLK